MINLELLCAINFVFVSMYHVVDHRIAQPRILLNNLTRLITQLNYYIYNHPKRSNYTLHYLTTSPSNFGTSSICEAKFERIQFIILHFNSK